MRIYNKWAGNPKGVKEDKMYCVAELYDDFISHQCLHKRGYGPHKEYCKQHARMLANGRHLYIPDDENNKPGERKARV